MIDVHPSRLQRGLEFCVTQITNDASQENGAPLYTAICSGAKSKNFKTNNILIIVKALFQQRISQLTHSLDDLYFQKYMFSNEYQPHNKSNLYGKQTKKKKPKEER